MTRSEERLERFRHELIEQLKRIAAALEKMSSPGVAVSVKSEFEKEK
jgi:hypothetical protein